MGHILIPDHCGQRNKNSHWPGLDYISALVLAPEEVGSIVYEPQLCIKTSHVFSKRNQSAVNRKKGDGYWKDPNNNVSQIIKLREFIFVNGRYQKYL